MQLRLQMGLTRKRLRAAGVVLIAAPFISVNGGGDDYDGWSAEYAATPAISTPVPFTVSREGFDTSGAAKTHIDTYYVTSRVRQTWPNHASPTALKVALSDYIYSTDTPTGVVTNNSTTVSPKAVANFATPDRYLIGDTIGGSTIPVEVISGHRDARDNAEIACVVFTISDGVTSISVTVGTPTVSNYPGDRHAVVSYALPSTNIASLNDGTVTVNADVYPWIGDATSVRTSVGATNRRKLSPRYFQKNTAKYASPDIMYVNGSTGNDSTAQVNNPSLPALTVMGAINRMRTGSTGAPWNLGTTKIVIAADGTYNIGASASGASTGAVGALVITRDTGATTKAGVILQGGSASFYPNITAPATPPDGALRFENLTINRAGGALNWLRGISLEFQLVNVDFNASSQNSAWCTTSGGATDQLIVLCNVDLAGFTGGQFGAVTQMRQGLWRGVNSVDLGSATDASLHVGCDIRMGSGGSIAEPFGETGDDLILAFNRYINCANANNIVIDGDFATGFGVALLQNVIEYTTATTGLGLGVMNDSKLYDTNHVIIHNNTFVGSWNNGRCNLFYDDGGTQRSHKLMSVRGNIFVSINTKGDVFRGVNELNPEGFTVGSPSTRTGAFAYMYGVGCFFNYIQYADASGSSLGGSFNQVYPGYGTVHGTSDTTPNMANSHYTDFEASGIGTSGAGGGTYTLTSNAAPVGGLNNNPCLSHDLAGTARPSTGDTIGAYLVPA